jgi:hypothetical protein
VSWSRRGALAALLALGACGPLPQPFRGRPGELARRLAQPPAWRLAVPAPTRALLPEADAATLSAALARSLSALDVPVVAGPALPLDWRLEVAAEPTGRAVTPRFALSDADGNPLGQVDGRPVPAAEWARGGEALLRRVAEEAAPALAERLALADAARRTGDRQVARNAGPVLRVLPVRGAPGDGNRSLTERMRTELARAGFVVQDAAEGAGFALQGEVTMARAATRGQQRVEIVWIVTRRDGEDLGRVVQLNEVPARSLDGLWADVALVVAEEAAPGVRQVVLNAGGFGAAATP